MSSSHRVLRPRKTKPTYEALSKPSIKRTRSRRPKQPAKSNAPVKSLPLELITLILENVDSPRTLATASRACRTLQFEAERLLYRKIDVEHVRHVRGLHQALTKSSIRASFVNALRLHMRSGFSPVLPLVNDIFLSLTKLVHPQTQTLRRLGRASRDHAAYPRQVHI